MEVLNITLRMLVVGGLFGIHGIGDAAELAAELDDGWHNWDVQAGAAGAQSCCYHIGSGVRTAGCRLGSSSGSVGIAIDGDCAPSDTLKVYVRVDDGDVAEVRALSAACPVEATVPVQQKGAVDTAESIAWLIRYAREESSIADDVVVAIALHEDNSAYKALKSLIEDRDRGMDIRRHALFWLAHSGSDAAFEYIDRLLSTR